MTHNPADPFDARTRAAPVLETFVFATEGDHPADHAKRVEEMLQDVEGVTKVEAHPSEQRVVVTYDARKASPASIHAALEQKGYQAARWAGE